MFVLKEYIERDPAKKDANWATKIIGDIREHWQTLVDPKTAKDNMDYLLSSQSMDHVKNMFKDKGENSNLRFARLAVVEKFRNILISERDKSGIYLGLQSIDPTVVDTERKKDIDLLRWRKAREAIISTLNAKIGEPGYKIDNSKFSGNIESFDDIGLNEEDDEELNYFFATHWRLLQEIRGEIPLNYFVKYNKLASNIGLWCNDILAKKAIASRVFVNQISGAITIDYLAPETVKLLIGRKKDFSDALAMGTEQNVSVQQLIRHLGSDFDATRDYQLLMTAVNNFYNTEYTGLTDGSNYVLWDCSQGLEQDKRKNCTWNDFLQYKLSLGYIEWKSNDATAFKKGLSVNGNPTLLDIKYSTEVESEHYEKETLENEVTYKAYFIPISGNTQRVFKFGKLWHQTVKGGEDEYSNFSICAYKEVGPPAIEVIKPYIDIIQQLWTKFEWMVRKAKPQGRTYNYEVLVQIATKMIKDGDNASKVSALMSQFEEGINDIYTIPTVGGNKITGGGTNPFFDKKNGLDATAKEFLEGIATATEKLADDLGINSIREAYSPSPNDGYKLQMAALQQSRNATEYISSMLMRMLDHVGSQILLMCQDIIKYKTSTAYKFLVSAIGQDTVNALEQCEFSHHRMGLFIDTFNRDFERQEMKDATKQAYYNKEIDFAQMMLINSISNYKKAAEILAYEKRRQEKILQKQEQVKHENIMQQIAAKEKADMKLESLKGNLANKGKDITGQYLVKAAGVTADGGIKKKEMEIENTDGKIEAKSEADIKKEKEKGSILNQTAL